MFRLNHLWSNTAIIRSFTTTLKYNGIKMTILVKLGVNTLWNLLYMRDVAHEGFIISDEVNQRIKQNVS